MFNHPNSLYMMLQKVKMMVVTARNANTRANGANTDVKEKSLNKRPSKPEGQK